MKDETRFIVVRDTAGEYFVMDGHEQPVKSRHRYANTGGYLSQENPTEAKRRADNIADLLNQQHREKEQAKAAKQLSLI